MRSRAGISSQSKNEAIMKWLSRVATMFSILVRLLLLVSWKLDIVVVITAGGDREGMARSTAVALLLSGVSLLAWRTLRTADRSDALELVGLC